MRWSIHWGKVSEGSCGLVLWKRFFLLRIFFVGPIGLVLSWILLFIREDFGLCFLKGSTKVLGLIELALKYLCRFRIGVRNLEKIILFHIQLRTETFRGTWSLGFIISSLLTIAHIQCILFSDVWSIQCVSLGLTLSWKRVEKTFLSWMISISFSTWIYQFSWRSIASLAN